MRKILKRVKAKAKAGAQLTGRGLLFATKVVVNPSRAKWEAEEFYDKHRDRVADKIDSAPDALRDRKERFINWFENE